MKSPKPPKHVWVLINHLGRVVGVCEKKEDTKSFLWAREDTVRKYTLVESRKGEEEEVE